MTQRETKYELMYILDATRTEEDIAALVERFKTLIESNGVIHEHVLMGRKKLAYMINDMPDGYYVLVKFTSRHDFPEELRRVLGITEGVMRSLVTKAVD